MTTSRNARITDEHQRQYQTNGYFVLQRVIPEDHLRILREECQTFIDIANAEMSSAGKDVMGVNRRNKRYVIGNRYGDSRRLSEFLFSELMSGICLATLGPEAFLFNEQYIVKCDEAGMKFPWHQDSAYIGHPHCRFVSCWCALDDVNEDNGTIYILPYSRAPGRGLVERANALDEIEADAYSGDDPGESVNVPAGSVAVFSSTCFHRSSANPTNTMRRVYLAQYSPGIIMAKDGSKPWGLSEPFLHDGRAVRSG